MSQFPAVLPVNFETGANSLPLTLPYVFGVIMADTMAQTVTAAATSAVGRFVTADTGLSVSASVSSSTDRFVTADSDTGCSASSSSSVDRFAYGDSSTDVQASISTAVTHVPSSNIASITITAGSTCEAVVSTECDTQLSITSDLLSIGHSTVFVSSSTVAQADRDFDLHHVANTDTELAVALDLFSGLELGAKANAHLAAGPVPQSIIDMLAIASANPILITVARSTDGSISAHISSTTSVGVEDFSSETSTAPGNSVTTVTVQLDSDASAHLFAGSTRNITASIVSQIRAALVGNAELHAYDVPDVFLSLHQNINTSTLAEFSTVVIASKPLFSLVVPAYDKRATVRASPRNATVPASSREVLVGALTQSGSASVAASPRGAAVAGSTRTVIIYSIVQSRSASIPAVVNTANTGLA